MIITTLPLVERPEPMHHQKPWNSILLLRGVLLRLRSSTGLRVLGYGAFALTSLLYASFYPVAKPALDRLDTLIFVALQMLWLVPPALFLLIWARWRVSWQTLLRSVVLGSCMSAALLCLTLAIASTSITETAMFSCMNGVIVVLFSWLFLRQRIHPLTWLACACSVGGIGMLLSVSRMHWQGDLLAFLGGLLLTGYTFLIERLPAGPQPQHSLKSSLWAACGIEWLTMAGETLLVALLFGDWRYAHLVIPSDLLTLSYVSWATTLLPMLIMVVMRKHVNGVTLTFMAILEPLVDAWFAFFFLHEHFLSQVYLGGVLAVGSVLLQAFAGYVSSPSVAAGGRSRWWSRLFHFRQRAMLLVGDLVGVPLYAKSGRPLGRQARASRAALEVT